MAAIAGGRSYERAQHFLLFGSPASDLQLYFQAIPHSRTARPYLSHPGPPTTRDNLAGGCRSVLPAL